MTKYYVKDKELVQQFNHIAGVVDFLEKVIRFKKKIDRAEWMQHMSDLGHGYDDANGENFTNSMREFVEIGVIRQDGKLLPCNVYEATKYSKPEYGD